jgi:polynucleotide 5'-hydroxyl-kinase GRC3/NOL9
MDLDPKRQEYAPGGQISLVVLRDLNLSPSFTHPSIVPDSGDATRNEVIRSHPIPMNFANYAEYYQSCVEDLFLAYRNLCARDPSLPLVIDTPGFLYTSHFDIINKLLTRLKPHNIVHLGETQGYDTETAARLHLLQTTALQYRSTLQEITAQQPQSTPIRTEAELNIMQIQSYFHLKSSSTNPDQPQVLSWTPDPLSRLIPWEFCYEETSERTQDIVGFAMYNEPVEPVSLLHALNGSIIQIIQSTSSVVPTPYTSLPRTGKHRIPYLPESERTGMVEPLDPRTTRLICTAMIRGFDPERRVVQVLVPKTHEALLYNLAPERTVLVSGCCDVPEWAFVEDAYAAEGASGLPWVEDESTIEEMGYLNTVRRVRKFQT